MTAYTMKVPADVANPNLPAVADLYGPSAKRIAWIGGGEGATSSGRYTALNDRENAKVYPAVNGNAAEPGSANGVPFFDFRDGVTGEGYSVSTSGDRASFTNLSALTVIFLAGSTAVRAAGAEQYLFSTFDASNLPLLLLRFEVDGSTSLATRRRLGSETQQRIWLPGTPTSYPIICAEWDFANDRTRLTDLLTGKSTNWAANSIPGTSGQTSATSLGAVRFFGYAGNTSRIFGGVASGQMIYNDLLTDIEKTRATNYLVKRRQRLPALV